MIEIKQKKKEEKLENKEDPVFSFKEFFKSFFIENPTKLANFEETYLINKAMMADLISQFIKWSVKDFFGILFMSEI